MQKCKKHRTSEWWAASIYLFLPLAMPDFSCSCTMWNLAPWPGVNSVPPVLGAWNVNHWTIKRSLKGLFFFFIPLGFLFYFAYNSMIIALQCCVGVGHTTMWISHKYMYIPPLLNLLSTPPSRPSRFSQSTGVKFPVLCSNFPLANYFTYSNVYVPKQLLNR